MKKIIAFVMAMVVVLAMAGCAGSGINVNINGGGTTTAPAANGTTAAAEGTEGTDVTTLPDETKPVPPVETEEPTVATTEAVPTEEGLGFGTYENGVYVNAYLGIEFAPTETFTFATEAEMKTANGIDANLTGAELQVTLEGMASVHVASASAADGTVVNLLVINNDTMSVEEYLDAVGQNTMTNLEGMGATGLTVEDGTVNNSLAGVLISGTLSGESFYQVSFAWRVDGYIVCGQVTTTGNMDRLNEILQCVSAEA